MEAYLAAITTAFREVRRVLRPTGTLWMNCGDGYDAGARSTRAVGDQVGGKHHGYWTNSMIDRRTQANLGPKQLLGMAWRSAFALQADGWILRSEIIWNKPTPLPESVTDRPSRAHEHLFLFAKSLDYFYDADAIKEPASADTHARYARGRSVSHKYQKGGPGDQTITRSLERMAVGHPVQPGVNPKALLNDRGNRQNSSFSAAVVDVVEDRNKRTVWTVRHPGYGGAHFATFPEALVEPCLLAGCPLGGLVLDPFVGSGTVGAVAERLDRRWVGLDLAYQDLATARTAQRGLRFAERA